MSILTDWVFDNFLFHPWPGRWFAHHQWRQICWTTAVALSLGASGLFMLEQRLLRLQRAPPQRFRRAFGLVIALLSFLAYFHFFNPNTRYSNYYHRHELYHYYLGSKYSGELGYKRLYTCTAIAEVQLGFGANVRKAHLRDLSAHNLLVPVSETYVFSDPEQCTQHFTEARWEAFKADVAWFERSSRGDYWEGMRVDHGYNPPPVWTMVGKLIASLAPAGDHFFKLLAAIDVALQASSLLLLGWAFGWRTLTVAAVFWGCNGAANFEWTCGAFLRQDWYFLMVAALCLARKRMFALSGAALTWSALLRVFPLLFFAGVGIIFIFQSVRKRQLNGDHVRFAFGSLSAGVVLVAASAAVVGIDAYPAFVDHIGSHRATQLTNNMGLEMLLGQSWEGRMAYARDVRLDDTMQPWKEVRSARLQTLRPILVAINVGVLAWLAWALRRTRLLWVGMALSTPLLMFGLSLTCYYYAFCVALAVLVKYRRALGPAYLALAGSSQILLHRFHFVDDRYVAQSFLFLVFGVCCLYACSRSVRIESTLLRSRWSRRSAS